MLRRCYIIARSECPILVYEQPWSPAKKYTFRAHSNNVSFLSSKTLPGELI